MAKAMGGRILRGVSSSGLAVLGVLAALQGCEGRSTGVDGANGARGGTGGAASGGSSGVGTGGTSGGSTSGSSGGGSGGSGGTSGAGSSGNACCPEDPCGVNETLHVGSFVYDVPIRRAAGCSCEAYCVGFPGEPQCDPGDERASGPCPPEDGCYQRYSFAMYVWCRRVDGEGGAGGDDGEAGAAGAAGAP